MVLLKLVDFCSLIILHKYLFLCWSSCSNKRMSVFAFSAIATEVTLIPPSRLMTIIRQSVEWHNRKGEMIYHCGHLLIILFIMFFVCNSLFVFFILWLSISAYTIFYYIILYATHFLYFFKILLAQYQDIQGRF